MFILPVVKDHLIWETIKLNSRFIQVSLFEIKLGQFVYWLFAHKMIENENWYLLLLEAIQHGKS